MWMMCPVSTAVVLAHPSPLCSMCSLTPNSQHMLNSSMRQIDIRSQYNSRQNSLSSSTPIPQSLTQLTPASTTSYPTKSNKLQVSVCLTVCLSVCLHTQKTETELSTRLPKTKTQRKRTSADYRDRHKNRERETRQT